MKIIIVLMAVFSVANSAFAKVVSHRDGLNFSVQQEIPQADTIWLAEDYMQLKDYSNSQFESFNRYVEKTTGEPIIKSDKEYIYVAKVSARVKWTPTYLDKNKFMTFAYQQKALAGVTLTPVKDNPFEILAVTNLVVTTLRAPLFPAFLDTNDLESNPELTKLLINSTPSPLPLKAITYRVSGQFDGSLSRMIAVNNFYQISDSELLDVSHVVVSIEKNKKTEGPLGWGFKKGLSALVRKIMIGGLSATQE
jgi:hypothetical protein